MQRKAKQPLLSLAALAVPAVFALVLEARPPGDASAKSAASPIGKGLPQEAYVGPAGCLPSYGELRNALMDQATRLHETRNGAVYRLGDGKKTDPGAEVDAPESTKESENASETPTRYLHLNRDNRRLEVCDALRRNVAEEFRGCQGPSGLIYQIGRADSEFGDFLTLARKDSTGRATACSWTLTVNQDLDRRRSERTQTPVYVHSYIWKCDGPDLAESFSRLEALHPERRLPAVRAAGRPILQQTAPENSWALTPDSIPEEWQSGFYLEDRLRALCETR